MKNRTWGMVKKEIDRLISNDTTVSYIDITANDVFYIHQVKNEDEGCGICSKHEIHYDENEYRKRHYKGTNSHGHEVWTL